MSLKQRPNSPKPKPYKTLQPRNLKTASAQNLKLPISAARGGGLNLEGTHAELDNDSAFCLVQAVICVAEGWCKRASELWSPRRRHFWHEHGSRQVGRSQGSAAAEESFREHLARNARTVHWCWSQRTFAAATEGARVGRGQALYMTKSKVCRHTSLKSEASRKNPSRVAYNIMFACSYLLLEGRVAGLPFSRTGQRKPCFRGHC